MEINETTSGAIPIGHKPLFDSVASLFENPEFSDLIIRCDDKTWHVHKAVVCLRSDFFKKACTGQFKEGLEGIVNLPDDDKCIVHEMLRYLYTADYQDQHLSDYNGNNHNKALERCCYTPMLFNVHMHTIADKYNIPALVTLADVKYAQRATGQWNAVDFADSVHAMYCTKSASCNKDSLHAVAVETAVYSAKMLYESDSGERFRAVASMTPEFASALAAQLAQLISRQGPPFDVSKWPLAEMTITIKSPTGKVFGIEISPSDHIQAIREAVEKQLGIPASQVGFIFNGEPIVGGKTAMDHGIQANSVVHYRLLPNGHRS